MKSGPTSTGSSSRRSPFGRARLLIAGCGDTGMAALPALAGRLRVFALTSNPERKPELRRAGAIPLVVDLDDPASLKRLRGLASRLLMLAPPPVSGAHDTRSRQLSRALRAPASASHPGRSKHPPARTARQTFATAIVANATRGRVGRGAGFLSPGAHRQPGLRIVYASTSGVYGDRKGAWVSEHDRTAPQSDRARRRVDAERTWRRVGPARARQARLGTGPWRTTVLRIPGIYGRDRLPVERLRKGLPRLHAADDVYTNHIELTDLARICVAALWRGRSQRTVHAVDGQELKMGDYFDAVAGALNLRPPPRMSADEVRAAVSPAMWSFMAESRRLSNQRLSKELRVRLRYPTVQSALGHWFGPHRSGEHDDTQG